MHVAVDIMINGCIYCYEFLLHSLWLSFALSPIWRSEWIFKIRFIVNITSIEFHKQKAIEKLLI